VLPEVVPHADAAFNAARSALLVAALTTGTTDVLWEATQDRLHQGYRAPGQPESSELLGRLRQAGLAAVISGAGPSVLVLAKSQSEVETARELAGSAWRGATPALDRQGAHLF
jgi:homoserine kinase